MQNYLVYVSLEMQVKVAMDLEWKINNMSDDNSWYDKAWEWKTENELWNKKLNWIL